MKKIVVSSGHSRHVIGARSFIDEVTEARRVTTKLVEDLRSAGVQATSWHDDTSTTLASNLNAIVNHHNAQARDLDISVHFNAHSKTELPRGVEVLYVSSGMAALAAKVSKAIANASGLIDRGAKYRTNLAFLNRTKKPAILLEICFVDSAADVKLYRAHFDAICKAAAEAIGGKSIPSRPAGV